MACRIGKARRPVAYWQGEGSGSLRGARLAAFRWREGEAFVFAGAGWPHKRAGGRGTMKRYDVKGRLVTSTDPRRGSIVTGVWFTCSRCGASFRCPVSLLDYHTLPSVQCPECFKQGYCHITHVDTEDVTYRGG